MTFYYRLELDGIDYTAPFEAPQEDGICRAQPLEGVEARLICQRDDVLHVQRCRVEVENRTGRALCIARADVAWLEASAGCAVEYFGSHWGSEYSPARKKITDLFTFGTYSGRSSLGCTPWMGLELQDGFRAATVAWSGNWDARIQPLAQGGFLVSMGITSWKFQHTLLDGAVFCGAAVCLTACESDMEACCFDLRRYFRQHVSLLDPNMESLPVEYNSWWPHEDKTINEEVMLDNARVAARIGCTHATMDAGWFGDDKNWVETRGDWAHVNRNRFPSGMEGLGAGIRAFGLHFGLWCEIEAVGPKARLNEERPALIARRDGTSLGYVCMGSEEGRKWALGILCDIIEQYGASWIKLDFNLDPGRGCGCTEHGHGPDDGVYAHYRGYYQMLDDLRRKHPHVILEDCSSGGLRNDYDALSHHHYAFLSDPDYTEHHLQCFWGAAALFHPSACLHFSWSQTLIRDNVDREPIKPDMPKSMFDYIIRAALLGVPGFSYRLREFPAWCLDRLAEHIAFYKEISGKFILRGEMYRLTGQPLRGGGGERWAAFQYLAEDGEQLIFVFRLEEGADRRTLYPRGLQENVWYQVRYTDHPATLRLTGGELMRQGLNFSCVPESGSEIVRLTPEV